MNKHTNPGIYGTKVSSWDHGPRSLFRTLRLEHPDMDIDDFVPIFRKALREHPDAADLTRSIFVNWCSNADRAMQTMTEAERDEAAQARADARVQRREESKRTAELAVQIAETLVKAKANSLIMATPQPNGKMGIDCTGSDWKWIVRHNKKASQLEEFLARDLKANERTGDKFENDAQIKRAATKAK